MSSGHEHHAAANPSSANRLAWTLVLIVLYTIAEVVGGIMSGSLAVLADAGHMVSDAGAIGLALFAMRYARRPPTATRTYGSYRVEILAALVNGATLVGIAIVIFIGAFQRLSAPPPVEAPLMLAVATGGLFVNLIGLWLLRGSHQGNLNMRGAWLHVLTDLLGSVQAIIAAVVIWTFGWFWVDPIASILIALLVVYSSWSLLRQSVAVLMESAPGHIDVDALRDELTRVPGVQAVHDLHIWSITSGFVALSAHLVVARASDAPEVVRLAETCLAERFAIKHSTLQLDIGGECRQAHHDVH